MAKLYDSSSNLLSNTVSVIPKQNAIKIERATLDGQLDVQTIGTPEEIFDILCYALYDDMETIIEAAATGELVTIVHESTSYSCYIKSKPFIQRENRNVKARRYYRLQFSASIVTTT